MQKNYNLGAAQNYDADRGDDDRIGLPEIISESGGAANEVASTAGNLDPRNKEEMIEFKEPGERRLSFGALEVNPLSKRSLHNDLMD